VFGVWVFVVGFVVFVFFFFFFFFNCWFFLVVFV